MDICDVLIAAAVVISDVQTVVVVDTYVVQLAVVLAIGEIEMETLINVRHVMDRGNLYAVHAADKGN